MRIVMIAGVELFHFESQTREPVVEDWERRTVTERWGRPARDAFAPSGESTQQYR